MQKKEFVLNSLKYILVSGVSKGFNYLILLYFAIGIYSEQYVAILLLLSFEQLLSLLLPLNNSSIIYSKNILNYNLITNKLISSSLLMVVIYVVLFLFFKNNFYRYFDIDNSIIFFSIFSSMLMNAYLVYLTGYYKLIEEHGKALLIQFLFLISFISIVLFVLFLDNKILAFFLGKATGLLLILLLVKILRLDLTKFTFNTLSLNEYKKILNLFSVSILGWVSGLGFLNLAKVFAAPENLATIGYILNLWNIFLLISTGINAVYYPLIKRFILQKELNKAKKAKRKALFIYLGISLLCFVMYLIIESTSILYPYPKINAVFSVIPYTILIFLLSIFYYVMLPFYLTNDKFGIFNIINLVSLSLWGVLIIVSTYVGFENYIWFLVLLYFLKSMFLYFYAEIKLMANKQNDQF
jgi:O-antigen/teichoic acid export membrane protein